MSRFLLYAKRSCLPGRIFFTALLLVLLTQGVSHAIVRVEPLFWHTGILGEGAVVKQELRIYNGGSNPLLLRRIFHSCDCLKVAYSAGTIQPAGFATATLELTAFDLENKFEEFLYIETDDPGTPIIRYSITGGMRTGGRHKVYPPLQPGVSGRALIVHFFFSPSCGGCDELRTGVFADVMREFGDMVAIIEHDVSDTSDGFFNYRLLRAYEERFKIKASEPAEAFVGNNYILGKESVSRNLLSAVEKALESINDIPIDSKGGGSWYPAPIVGAIVYGLLDGLNPCVFAGLVFFLSYLLISGLSGRVLFLVGLVYSTGVFITYVCIGLSLFGFFYAAEMFPTVSGTFTKMSAVLALVVGLLSLRDGYVAYHGRINDIWLRLPKGLQDKMHQMVRNQRKRFALLFSTFLLGCLVTIIEGACTGLQYVPMARMMIIAGDHVGSQLFGLFLLLIYNLAFMVPLLFIFVSVMVCTKQLGAAGALHKEAIGVVRYLTGVGLLFLGIVMLVWK